MGKWKKEAAQSSTELTQEQFKYQQKLIDQREKERTNAMGVMQGLLNESPQYKIPGQVQQYTDMMNTLGAQLYGLQDASGGEKSIDPNLYKSKTEQIPVAQFNNPSPKGNAPIDPSKLTANDFRPGGGWWNNLQQGLQFSPADIQFTKDALEGGSRVKPMRTNIRQTVRDIKRKTK